MIDFDHLWNYDDPAATEVAFRAVLPDAQASPDSEYLPELLTQIARAQGLQRQFVEAQRTLDRVESMLIGRLPRVQVRYLLERGRVFNSAQRPELAQPLFQAAWELARASGEGALAVDAAHMLAIVVPPTDQLMWNQTALDLAQASPDPWAQRWCGSLYNNIGWTYHAMEQFEDALAIFHTARQWHVAQGHEKETRVATWCIGRTLRALGRIEDALALQENLKQELAAAGQTDDGFVHEELGECLALLQRWDEAQQAFAQAYIHLSRDDWLVAYEQARLDRLRQLAGPAWPDVTEGVP